MPFLRAYPPLVRQLRISLSVFFRLLGMSWRGTTNFLH